MTERKVSITDLFGVMHELSVPGELPGDRLSQVISHVLGLPSVYEGKWPVHYHLEPRSTHLNDQASDGKSLSTEYHWWLYADAQKLLPIAPERWFKKFVDLIPIPILIRLVANSLPSHPTICFVLTDAAFQNRCFSHLADGLCHKRYRSKYWEADRLHNGVYRSLWPEIDLMRIDESQLVDVHEFGERLSHAALGIVDLTDWTRMAVFALQVLREQGRPYVGIQDSEWDQKLQQQGGIHEFDQGDPGEFVDRLSRLIERKLSRR